MDHQVPEEVGQVQGDHLDQEDRFVGTREIDGAVLPDYTLDHLSYLFLPSQ